MAQTGRHPREASWRRYCSPEPGKRGMGRGSGDSAKRPAVLSRTCGTSISASEKRGQLCCHAGCRENEARRESGRCSAACPYSNQDGTSITTQEPERDYRTGKPLQLYGHQCKQASATASIGPKFSMGRFTCTFTPATAASDRRHVSSGSATSESGLQSLPATTTNSNG